MNPRLILRPQGGGSPTELPRQGRLLIGSDESRADYVLEGSGIEGVHCAIGRLKDGGWAIKDLGSRFGTSVNGSPASAARLSPGDVIVLGSRRLVVEDPAAGHEDPAKATPPRPAVQTPEPELASTPAAAPPAAPISRAPARATAPVIPGFTIQRFLGKGASGSVWLARQESLARDVALKVLSPKLSQDTDFVARFQAEARAAAALNHPNVVHVYDVGAANGVHYLCMEFMDDGCLETNLLVNGPLPWREVLQVLRDSALGLAYAQTQGLIHRDIKPANLMRGSDGRTRLADLGLATSIEAVHMEGGNGAGSTQRKLVGTPQFLAPEVIRGEPASPASDLYSLGASAYRLLSGHTPFEGERTADVLRSVLKDEPQGLGPRVPGLPTPVAGLVHRMLAKSPNARPASARVVVDEIDNILAGRSARSLPGIHTAEEKKPPLLLVGGLLLAGFLVWYFMNLEGRKANGEDPAPDIGVVSTETTPNIRADTQDPAPPASTEGNPPLVQVPGPQDPVPEDNDGAEKAFEARAQTALLALEAQTLTDKERIGALQALAEEWAGSTTASVALDAAEALKTQQGAIAQLNQELDTRRQAILEAMRAAAQASRLSPELLPILTRIAGVPGQAEFSQDLPFQQGKATILTEVLDGAVTRADQIIAQANKLITAGQFDGVAPLLQIFLEHLGLPNQTTGEDPRLALLRKREASATQTLRNLSRMEASFQSAQSNREESMVITALSTGGPDGKGILGDLQGGKVRQAHETLSTLLTQIKTPALAIPLNQLHRDLEAGLRVLQMLSASFTNPGWRRRTVLDLRDRQDSFEVVACDENGPKVLRNGVPDHLGWAPFINSAKGMQHLFDRRMDRPFNDQEETDIGALVRLAAIMESTNIAEPLLSARVCSERDIEGLTAPFDQALTRRRKDISPQESSLLGTERTAAQTLGLALQALSGDDPHTASILLQRLRDEFPSSIFRLLLDACPKNS